MSPERPGRRLRPALAALAVAGLVAGARPAVAAAPGVWYFNAMGTNADRTRLVVGGSWEQPPANPDSVLLAWGFLERGRQTHLYPETGVDISGEWLIGAGGTPAKSWRVDPALGFPPILWGPGRELWLDEPAVGDAEWTWPDLLDAVEAAWRHTALNAEDSTPLGLVPIGRLGNCDVLSRAVDQRAPDSWLEKTLPHHALASVAGLPYTSSSTDDDAKPVRVRRFVRWLQPQEPDVDCAGTAELTLFTAGQAPLLTIPEVAVRPAGFFDLDVESDTWYPGSRRLSPVSAATPTVTVQESAAADWCDLPDIAPLCRRQEKLRSRVYTWSGEAAAGLESQLAQALISACTSVFTTGGDPEAAAHCSSTDGWRNESFAHYRVGYAGPWTLSSPAGWTETWDPAAMRVHWTPPASITGDVDLRLLDGGLLTVRAPAEGDRPVPPGPGNMRIEREVVIVGASAIGVVALALIGWHLRRRRQTRAEPAAPPVAPRPAATQAGDLMAESIATLEQAGVRLDGDLRQQKKELEKQREALEEHRRALVELDDQKSFIDQLRDDPWQALGVKPPPDPEPRLAALESLQAEQSQQVADLQSLTQLIARRPDLDELRRDLTPASEQIVQLSEVPTSSFQDDLRRHPARLQTMLHQTPDIERLESLLASFRQQPELLEQLHDLVRRAPRATWWTLLERDGESSRRLSVEEEERRARERYAQAADELDRLPRPRREALCRAFDAASRLGYWIVQLWPAMRRALRVEPDELWQRLPEPAQEEWRRSQKILWQFAAVDACVFRCLAAPPSGFVPSALEGALLGQLLRGDGDFEQRVRTFFKPPGAAGRLAEVVLALQYLVEAYPVEHLSREEWQVMHGELVAGVQGAQLPSDFHELVSDLASGLGLCYRAVRYYSSHYDRPEMEFIKESVSAVSLAERLGFAAQTEPTLVVRLHEPFLFNAETGSFQSGHALVSDG